MWLDAKCMELELFIVNFSQIFEEVNCTEIINLKSKAGNFVGLNSIGLPSFPF